MGKVYLAGRDWEGRQGMQQCLQGKVGPIPPWVVGFMQECPRGQVGAMAAAVQPVVPAR